MREDIIQLQLRERCMHRVLDVRMYTRTNRCHQLISTVNNFISFMKRCTPDYFNQEAPLCTQTFSISLRPD